MVAIRQPTLPVRAAGALSALLLACAGAAAQDAPPPAAISFAYANSHPVTPLSSAAIAMTISTDGRDSDEADAFDEPHPLTVDMRIGAPRPMSRVGLCNAVVSVARANDLPIAFFANLIWQESGFDTRVVSRAGALGVAQFMPRTANEYGLINPFEPIHALHSAARLLRRLHGQFGNPGLAAAAYNAGPRRVSEWMAKRGGLPGETRAYVARITGNAAEQWTSSEFVRGPEATLMPAKAPCAEVAQAVEEQGKVVRVVRLMAELAATTRMPAPAAEPDEPKFDEVAWTAATSKPEWQAFALDVARGAVRNIHLQQAREARAQAVAPVAAKDSVKKDSVKRITPALARAWERIAERTMRKAAAEFAKLDDESAEPPAERRRAPRTPRQRVAYWR